LKKKEGGSASLKLKSHSEGGDSSLEVKSFLGKDLEKFAVEEGAFREYSQVDLGKREWFGGGGVTRKYQGPLWLDYRDGKFSKSRFHDYSTRGNLR